jgi:hypothetical protein
LAAFPWPWKQLVSWEKAPLAVAGQLTFPYLLRAATRQLMKLTKRVKIRKTYEMLQINWQ